MTDALGGLPTEGHRSDLHDLDLRSTHELVRLINEEDAGVPAAVGAAADALAEAIEAIVERLRAGGRLVYVGAGSSGRLAALDAAECGPTYSSPPGQVVALVAGGAEPDESAEDDAAAGATDIAAAAVRAEDAVVGISASGRTPYTLAALEAARAAGALTVAVTSVRDSELARAADHDVAVEVGPEVVSGSTRMKAGTAQKLVLNTISTVTMVRLGKTYGNLMVDVQASNDKLRARARRTVGLATGAGEAEVEAAVADADGDAKVAIVAVLLGVDAAIARTRLADAGGIVRRALPEAADVLG